MAMQKKINKKLLGTPTCVQNVGLSLIYVSVCICIIVYIHKGIDTILVSIKERCQIHLNILHNYNIGLDLPEKWTNKLENFQVTICWGCMHHNSIKMISSFYKRYINYKYLMLQSVKSSIINPSSSIFKKHLTSISR